MRKAPGRTLRQREEGEIGDEGPGLSRVEEEGAKEWPEGRWETKAEECPESRRERLGVRSTEDSPSDWAPWEFLETGAGAVSVSGPCSCRTPDIGHQRLGHSLSCACVLPVSCLPGLCLHPPDHHSPPPSHDNHTCSQATRNVSWGIRALWVEQDCSVEWWWGGAEKLDGSE